MLSPDDIATTAITIEEQTRGWLGLIRRYTDVHRQVVYYKRLVRLFDFFSEWQILPFDQPLQTNLRDYGSKEFDRHDGSQDRLDYPGARWDAALGL